MYRTIAGLAAFLLVITGLAALSFRASGGGEERADFTYVNGAEPKSLDPAVITGVLEGRLADALFEGLTHLDPETQEPVGGVAESWTLSPDGRTYRFRFRADARWSNGDPVTAHDFVWSWIRTVHAETGSEYGYMLWDIEHAEEYTQATRVPLLEKQIARARDAGDTKRVGELTRDLDDLRSRRAAHEAALRHLGVDGGFWAEDDRTLVLRLKYRVPYFLDLMAFHAALPVHPPTVKARPDDWFKDPRTFVGNGAFVLDDWTVYRRIRLRKSPTYWDRDRIRVNLIDALPVEEPNAALNAYLTGVVEWVNAFPSQLEAELKRHPEFRTGPYLGTYYYRLNNTHPALRDARVRRAIALAIDREQIVKFVTRMGEEPAYTFVPPALSRFAPPGGAPYEPPSERLRYDPDAARRLLAEAGYAGGRGIGKLQLIYNTLEGHRKVAEVVADQLRRNLGLDVQPFNQEWQAYLHSTQNLQYDLGRAGWIGDYLDPNTFLDLWVTGGGNNQTGYSNPFYDRLVRTAKDVDAFIADPGDLLPKLRDREAIESVLADIRRIDDALARAAGDGDGGRALTEERNYLASKVRMYLFRECERILCWDDVPIVPIYFYVTKNIVKPYVRGIRTYLIGPDGNEDPGRPNLRDVHPLRGIEILRGEPAPVR